jgi:two-component system CheB/CheR fusion protein
MRILPYRTVDNVIDGVVVTFIEITERKRSEEAVARLAAIVANSQEAIIAMAPDATITSWNGGAERIYGFGATETIGRPLTLIMDKDRAGEVRQILSRIRRPTAGGAVETERRTKDGRRIFVLSSVSPIRAGNGKLIGVAAIERDITDRKLAEQQQKILLSELNHRVKNTLATVLSISSRTRQTTASLADFGKSFEGRVRSLANAHELLSRNMWSGVDLRQLLQQELAPYTDSRGASVTLTGKPLFLSAQASLALCMIFHELATNAAKHGALSAAEGRVAVAWKNNGGGKKATLTLTWSERGGPKPGKKRANGFGLSFMQRSVEYDFNDTLNLSFAPGGLRAALRVPIGELQTGTTPPPGAKPRK